MKEELTTLQSRISNGVSRFIESVEQLNTYNEYSLERAKHFEGSHESFKENYIKSQEALGQVKAKMDISVENTLHNESLVNTILSNVNDISPNSHFMKQQVATFIGKVKNVSSNMAGIAEQTNLLNLK